MPKLEAFLSSFVDLRCVCYPYLRPQRLFSIIEWGPQVTWETFKNDVVAGITVRGWGIPREGRARARRDGAFWRLFLGEGFPCGLRSSQPKDLTWRG